MSDVDDGYSPMTPNVSIMFDEPKTQDVRKVYARTLNIRYRVCVCEVGNAYIVKAEIFRNEDDVDDVYALMCFKPLATEEYVIHDVDLFVDFLNDNIGDIVNHVFNATHGEYEGSPSSD